MPNAQPTQKSAALFLLLQKTKTPTVETVGVERYLLSGFSSRFADYAAELFRTAL